MLSGFALIVVLAVWLVVAQLVRGSPAVPSARATHQATSVASRSWPSAAATVAENARPGTANWPLTDYAAGTLDGWADHVSVRPGQPVRLYVSTAAASFTVTVLRMGWYGGAGARAVWSSPPLRGVVQSTPTVSTTTRTVSAASWTPSLQVDTTGWVPGDYLFRLVGSDGHQSFVPLTVRSARTAGAVVLVNAVTTWQAYNAWDGYSLYHGPAGLPDYAHRSLAVSFDRPYGFGGGAADFVGNELPALSLAEQLGLPVAYVTDVDIDADPGLLTGARAVISLGHDEYWSAAMRTAVTAARDAGTNLAFLGANAIYRHIRFASTAHGPRRLEIDYKDGTLDPLYQTDPSAATFNWRDGPDPRPESVLTGTFYQCNPVHVDMVVADPNSWLLAGLDLAVGDRLPGLVGSEFDRVDLQAPTPRPIHVVFHSPVHCGGKDTYADAAYYSTASGAGVFDSGTSAWVGALDTKCTTTCADVAAQRVVRAITTTLLTTFARGPAGVAHPAIDNAERIETGTAPSVESSEPATPSERVSPTRSSRPRGSRSPHASTSPSDSAAPSESATSTAPSASAAPSPTPSVERSTRSQPSTSPLPPQGADVTDG